MVISETVMSTGHKTQNESYAYQEDSRIFFSFLFSLSKCQYRNNFTRLLHLHEKFIIIIINLFQDDIWHESQCNIWSSITRVDMSLTIEQT